MYITDGDYESILTMLNDCGKMWEHHPETYKGKGEESLRDQLMFVLAPNINGVVAGEAYNKKGRTVCNGRVYNKHVQHTNTAVLVDIFSIPCQLLVL